MENEPLPAPAGQPRRWWPWTVSLSLLAVAFGLFTALQVPRQNLRAKIQRLRDDGYGVSAEIRRGGGTPENQAAAAACLEAIREIKWSGPDLDDWLDSGHRPDDQFSRVWWAHSEFYFWGTDNEPVEGPPDIGDWMTRSVRENGVRGAEFSRIIRDPDCRFHRPPARVGGLSIEDECRFRQWNLLFCLRSCANARTGDTNAAREGLLDAFSLGDTLEQDALVASQVLRLRLAEQTLIILPTCIEKDATEESLRRWLAVLPGPGHFESGLSSGRFELHHRLRADLPILLGRSS